MYAPAITTRAAAWTAIAILVTVSTATASPTLEIDPTTFEAGDIVLVTIDGFTPGGYSGSIVVDGVPETTFHIPDGGATSLFWPTPEDLTVGGHDVYVCAACGQGEFETRSDTVRVTVLSPDLTGSEYNLQVWGIEVTQGVRGDFALRTPPLDDLAFPPEDVVHVANRRTVVRVYPWVEGGPDFTRVLSVKAYLWVTNGAETFGPLEAEMPRVDHVRADATIDDLRGDLRLTWNFVLPSDALFLHRDDTSGTFNLSVVINPDEPGRDPECDTCFDDNTAYLSGNEFQHVGLDGVRAMKMRAHMVKATVHNDDGSTTIHERPPAWQLSNAIRSMHAVLPIADGHRGIALFSRQDVDWEGPLAGWKTEQDEYLIENYLPGGELRAAPLLDYYGFFYVDDRTKCSGHAQLASPFFRTTACGVPSLTPAHELNHAIGAPHVGTGHGESGSDPTYPGSHGQVEPDTWGMDVWTLQVFPPTVEDVLDDARHDFMSYGDNEWVSRFTWERSALQLGSPSVGFRTPVAFPLVNERSEGVPEHIAFRGRFDGMGQLDLAPAFATWATTSTQTGSDYRLEFRDASEILVSTHWLDPIVMQDVDPGPTTFAESVPRPTSWQRMALLEGGVEIQSWLRSDNAPTVSLDAPASGLQWPNVGTMSFSWTGMDADGDPLHYRIIGIHQPDDEIYPIANGLVTQNFELDIADLPGGGDWVFLVEVSDGLDRNWSNGILAHVAPTDPDVLIVLPAEGATHVAGENVPVMAKVIDIQGDADESTALWYLDDVFMGSGTAFELPDVTAGEHEVEFVYYNAYQLEGRESRTLHVVPEIAPPDLVYPLDGAPAIPRPVLLEWSPVAGAISYRVQVAFDAGFQSLAAEIGNVSTTRIFFEAPTTGSTYHWRVMSEHGTAPSGWSASRVFTTGEEITPVEEVPDVSGSSLRVRPNPMARASSVAFTLPVDGNVSVEIFDAGGRRIRELARGHREAGAHRVPWDGRDDAGRVARSGVYFVRLTTPAGVEGRKLLVLR